MMINDAIRSAPSAYSVCFLLTEYIETLRFARKLPEELVALPIAGVPDVRSRFERLVAEFEIRLRLPDLSTFDIVVEAVNVFQAAIQRFSQLESPRTDMPLEV